MSLVSQLNERVTVERLIETDDGYGGKSTSWSELVNLWAQVLPVYNAINERVVAGQLVLNAGYRVILRARSDITASMRIQWKTHTLLIHSLHETNETLNILCYEEDL